MTDDSFNGRNNVMTVTESDFDATEALLSDEGGSDISNKSSTVSLSREYFLIPYRYASVVCHPVSVRIKAMFKILRV